MNGSGSLKSLANKYRITKRNYLYEDIFHLPENAKEFLQVYFLRMSLKWAKDDPRGGYSIQDDLDMVSWRLTELF